MPGPTQAQPIHWEPVDATARNLIVVASLEVGLVARQRDTGVLYQAVAGGAGASCWGPGATPGGAGSVEGPASSTANAVPRFSDTSGTLLKDSPITVSDAGKISGLAAPSAASDAARKADSDAALAQANTATTNAATALAAASAAQVTATAAIPKVGITTTPDLSSIPAGAPTLKVTATSDTPATTYTAHVASTDPAGYVEILVGSTSFYIPYFT